MAISSLVDKESEFRESLETWLRDLLEAASSQTNGQNHNATTVSHFRNFWSMDFTPSLPLKTSIVSLVHPLPSMSGSIGSTKNNHSYPREVKPRTIPQQSSEVTPPSAHTHVFQPLAWYERKATGSCEPCANRLLENTQMISNFPH